MMKIIDSLLVTDKNTIKSVIDELTDIDDILNCIKFFRSQIHTLKKQPTQLKYQQYYDEFINKYEYHDEYDVSKYIFINLVKKIHTIDKNLIHYNYNFKKQKLYGYDIKEFAYAKTLEIHDINAYKQFIEQIDDKIMILDDNLTDKYIVNTYNNFDELTYLPNITLLLIRRFKTYLNNPKNNSENNITSVYTHNSDTFTIEDVIKINNILMLHDIKSFDNIDNLIINNILPSNIHINNFDNLKYLNITYLPEPSNNEQITCVAHLPNLEILYINSNNTNIFISNLTNCLSLKSITFENLTVHNINDEYNIKDCVITCKNVKFNDYNKFIKSLTNIKQLNNDDKCIINNIDSNIT